MEDLTKPFYLKEGKAVPCIVNRPRLDIEEFFHSFGLCDVMASSSRFALAVGILTFKVA